MELHSGERLDDLQYKNLFIIQAAEKHRFGTDAVLLANFVRANANTRLIDIGCGTGILSILINGRTGAAVTAIDIQPDMVDMAARSANYNSQTNIKVMELDVRQAADVLGLGSFDAAVCNPPYFNTGTHNPNVSRAIAEHQLSLTIQDVTLSAYKLLKYGGKLFLCYPAQQLAEAMYSLMQNKLMPKRLCLVADNVEAPPYLALIEAKKGGAFGLVLEPLLILKSKDGTLSPCAKTIYHMEEI